MLEILYITFVKTYPPLLNENVFKMSGYSQKIKDWGVGPGEKEERGYEGSFIVDLRWTH